MPATIVPLNRADKTSSVAKLVSRSKPWQKTLRKFMDKVEIQLFLGCLLLLSLFLVDSYNLGNAPDSQDTAIDGVLIVIVSLFSLEVVILSAALQGYFNSFYFWMDLLGTLSILLDISWFSDLFGGDARNASNASVLRATRAAKLGARYGRILRMMKLLKTTVLCPCLRSELSKEEEEEPTLSAVSKLANELMNTSSMRVALLTVVIVIIVPFLGYTVTDYSPNAWIKNLHIAASDSTLCTYLPSMADSFHSFYVHKDAKIWSIKVESPYFDCGGTYDSDGSVHVGATQSYFVDEEYGAAGGRKVTKSVNLLEYTENYKYQGTNYHIKTVVDMTIPNQWDAFFGIMLMLLVIIVLFGFTASYHDLVEKLVVSPLQKLMKALRNSATTMIDSLKSLEKEKKDEGSKNRNESTVGSSEAEDEDVEAAALEKLVEKISKIVKTIIPSNTAVVEKNANIDKATADFINAQYTVGVNSHATVITARKTSLNKLFEEGNGENSAERAKIVLKQSLAKIINPTKLNSWEFDVLDVETHEELFTIVHYMFDVFFGFMEEFQMPPAVFRNFLSVLSQKYINTNSYHNFRHAVDVCHTSYRFMTLSEIGSVGTERATGAICGGALTSLEIMAVLVASLGHDVGHFAVNNGYLVKTKHILAFQHNDKSPLENMHCVLLYEIMAVGGDVTKYEKSVEGLSSTYRKSATLQSDSSAGNSYEPDRVGCDILSGLTETQWREFRKVVLSVILGTDMINHFEQVKKCQLFQELQKDNIMNYYTGETSTMECLTKDGGNRLFIMDIIVHCSDISNPIKPFTICAKWANHVVKEFFDQGDKEKALGLEVSPGFDRVTTNLCNMQMGFIEFVVAPLMNAMVNIFPPLHSIGENMADNFQTWGQKRIEEIQQDGKMADDAKNTEIGKLRDRLGKFKEKMSFVDAVKAELETARERRMERSMGG